MGYFNFFDEWAMDPKVQSMSETMQRRHAMLLCLRNIGETCETPDEEVATFMRIGMGEARKTKQLFNRKGFIDGSGWNVKHWDKRQDGQSESLKRVRKHRSKERYSNGNVTLQERDSNVTETLPRGRADLLTYLPTNVTKGEEDPLPPSLVLGPEFKRVGLLAEELGGDPSFAMWVVHSGKLGFPIEWIEAALRRCPKSKLRIDYLSAILRGYQQEGGPPKDSPNGVKSHSKPKPEPIITAADQAAADKMIADGMRSVEQARLKRLEGKSK